MNYQVSYSDILELYAGNSWLLLRKNYKMRVDWKKEDWKKSQMMIICGFITKNDTLNSQVAVIYKKYWW